MKRVFSTVLVLLTLLALTTGTVFAGSALELVEVRNDDGGPTFIFRVTGEFSASELEGGFVSVEGGEDYPLYCEQIDADTVVCHTSKKVSAHDVVVGFGGARFWVFVPDVRTGRTYCYSAWDWWPFTSYEWTDFGPICQDAPAEAGDFSYYSFPEQGIFNAWVVFFTDDVSDECGPDSVPWNGPAYYYPSCPGGG